MKRLKDPHMLPETRQWVNFTTLCGQANICQQMVLGKNCRSLHKLNSSKIQHWIATKNCASFAKYLCSLPKVICCKKLLISWSQMLMKSTFGLLMDAIMAPRKTHIPQNVFFNKTFNSYLHSTCFASLTHGMKNIKVFDGKKSFWNVEWSLHLNEKNQKIKWSRWVNNFKLILSCWFNLLHSNTR